jgi:hypothetical protein
VALATVQRWVARAKGQRLDRVDWTDRPCGLPTPVNRTERQREDLVLTLRQELRDTSDLGEFGAAAIHRAWLARGLPDPPSVRTIGLILERRGAQRQQGQAKTMKSLCIARLQTVRRGATGTLAQTSVRQKRRTAMKEKGAF